jgi:class 3 adenylate cyclase
MVKILPAPESDGSVDLKGFAEKVTKITKVQTSFVFYAEKDPEKCSFIAEKELFKRAFVKKGLLEEIALMAKKVDHRFLMRKQAVEHNLRTLYQKDFPQLYRLLGFINAPSIDLYRISVNYSSILDDLVYLVSIRYPGKETDGRHIFIGFRRSAFPTRSLIREFLKDFSNKQLQLRFGYSRRARLPDYFSENGRLSLLFEVPAELLKFQKLSLPQGTRPVFALEYDMKAIFDQSARDMRSFNTLLNLILMVTFLLTLAIAFGKANIANSIRLSVTAALFGSCLLPVIGLGWLSFSYSSDFSELRERRVNNALKKKIREVDNNLRLQKLKLLASIKSFGYLLEERPMADWPAITPRLDPTLESDNIRRFQYYNYLIIDRWAREFTRKRFSQSRGGELRPVMLGSSYKLLYDFGAFADKPAKEQNRIAQFADVSSGLTEQIADRTAQNRMFASEGEFFSLRTLPLEQLLGAVFLRKNGRILGIFSMLSNSSLYFNYLAELINNHIVSTQSEIDGFKIHVHLFRVSSANERSLHQRIFHAPGGIGYESDELFHSANSFYTNSDSAFVNNLGNRENNLILCDVIFDRQVFAMAIATPVRTDEVNPYLNLLLILLVSSVSSLSLSLGISNHLLRPIPAFVTAIRKLQKQEYDWEIKSQTTDQFSILARSFNHMTIKMQERKKMLNLVSRVAIDAVAGENFGEQMPPRYLQATILFSDIRSFTTISERYPADEVVSMLNDYLTAMCRIIESNGGFVDKIIGDAIQAVFVDAEPGRAVLSSARAALQMRRALKVFNQSRVEAGEFSIENGVGIATGRIISGLVGSDQGKLDATVFGMPLVCAQNIESLSKHAMRSHILVDEASAHILEKHSSLSFFHNDQGLICHELVSLNADGNQ